MHVSKPRRASLHKFMGGFVFAIASLLIFAGMEAVIIGALAAFYHYAFGLDQSNAIGFAIITDILILVGAVFGSIAAMGAD